MCGLVGIFSTSRSAKGVEALSVERMRDTLAHRGPDGKGLYVSPSKRIGLGFCRLAIIDLSPEAEQPMSNTAGTLRIVFNGEIYNHAELRAELEKCGRRFITSHSDTEVILVGYEEWGFGVVHRLRGMFSFAIWDETKKHLWLVRDRVGVKPLYYSSIEGMFFFASEMKALLNVEAIKREVDISSLYDHLTFVACPAPRTLIKNVYKLPAAHSLLISSDGSQKMERYWHPFSGVNSFSNESDDELANRIISLLRESVRYRMVSDVKVGVFLSGGIDSSTNTALMAEQMDRPVESFSVGFKGAADFTEFQYAQKIADRYKTNHHEIMLGPDDLIEFLPRLVFHQDEPIGDPVGVPVYFLSKLARENGVKVCQVGEGSDELFSGYPYWKTMLSLHKHLRVFGKMPVVSSALSNLGTHLPGLSWNARRRLDFLRRVSNKEPVFWGGAEGFQETLKERFVRREFKKRLGGYTSSEIVRRLREDFENDAPSGKDELHWMTYLDLRLRLPEILLMRVDKMTMAASVEGREPFLDHELIKLAMSIGQSKKLKGGETKYLLKKAVEPLLPREIIYRRKQGFGVPVDHWFQDRLKSWADDKILSFCKRTPYFEERQVADYLHSAGWQFKWFLLNLALWHEMWIEGEANLRLPC